MTVSASHRYSGIGPAGNGMAYLANFPTTSTILTRTLPFPSILFVDFWTVFDPVAMIVPVAIWRPAAERSTTDIPVFGALKNAGKPPGGFLPSIVPSPASTSGLGSFFTFFAAGFGGGLVEAMSSMSSSSMASSADAPFLRTRACVVLRCSYLRFIFARISNWTDGRSPISMSTSFTAPFFRSAFCFPQGTFVDSKPLFSHAAMQHLPHFARVSESHSLGSFGMLSSTGHSKLMSAGISSRGAGAGRLLVDGDAAVLCDDWTVFDAAEPEGSCIRSATCRASRAKKVSLPKSSLGNALRSIGSDIGHQILEQLGSIHANSRRHMTSSVNTSNKFCGNGFL